MELKHECNEEQAISLWQEKLLNKWKAQGTGGNMVFVGSKNSVYTGKNALKRDLKHLQVQRYDQCAE
jgi:hypothetical protein